MINTKAVMNLNLLYTLFTINVISIALEKWKYYSQINDSNIICNFQRGKDVAAKSLLKVNEHSLYTEVD